MKSKEGFTLIEIMVALAIFVILSLMAVAGLYAIIKSRDITARHTKALLQLQIAMVILQRDVEQMIDRPIVDNQGEPLPALIVKNNQMEFTRAGHVNPFGLEHRSTLLRVAYFVENNQLIRKTWPVLDRAPNTTSTQRILLTHINHFTIQLLDNTNEIRKNWPISITNNNEFQPLPKGLEIILQIQNMGTINRVFVIPGVGFVNLAQPS